MSRAHDLARQYNESLAARNPRLAEEIEWTVTNGGNLALRDIPERFTQRSRAIEQRRETERQTWLRRNREGQHSDPRLRDDEREHRIV